MSPRSRRTRWGLACLLLAAISLVPLGFEGRPDAAEDEYVIGVEDVLQIQVWDNKDLDQLLPVRPDGKISFPLVGDIMASGRTVAQLKDALTERLTLSIKNPNVSVMVKEIRSFRVYFVGRVAKPGVYPIRAGTPLLQALTLAGGVMEGADLTASYVVRGGQRIPVNLRRLVQDGDLTQNVALETGDTVVVPESAVGASVFIMGEVLKPGAYSRGDALTVMKLVSMAGGFTKYAAAGRVTLIRESTAPAAGTDPNGKVRLRIDLEAIQSDPRRHPDVPLQPGDVVIVPQTLF